MENLSPGFMMHGCREVLTLVGTAEFFERQIQLLEASVESAPELAFDLSRALIETTCKTILTDRGVNIEKHWLNNTPELFENTLRNLALFPDTHDTDAKALLGVENTVEGLQRAVLGLCQVRNAAGIASHGKDGYTHPMDSLQAMFAARAADSIVYFLYSAHKKYPGSATGAGRLYYDDNPDFNAYLDEQYDPVEIGSVGYLVSEILFHVDDEAYKAALMDYRAQQSLDETEAVAEV